MRRKGWIIFFFIFSLLFLNACQASPSPQAKDKDNKVKVFASFYPLADFAKKIGGSHVEVITMVPVGVEPHDYEPKIEEMQNLTSTARVFIYNGAGLESWATKAIPTLNKNTVVVEASKSIKLRDAQPGDEEEHGQYDPHVWLDPLLAKREAQNIRDGLIQADPQHKQDYEANYKKVAAQFDQLDQLFRNVAKEAKIKEFVTSHAAFGYLADRYGLHQIAVSGLSPSDEPSPRKMQEIEEVMRKKQIKYIFFEVLVSGKVAQAIQNDLHANAITLNPLEGLTQNEIKHGEDYFSIMKKNADNLAIALGEKR
jgi:zinc transport system substrate-binding protein